MVVYAQYMDVMYLGKVWGKCGRGKCEVVWAGVRFITWAIMDHQRRFPYPFTHC